MNIKLPITSRIADWLIEKTKNIPKFSMSGFISYHTFIMIKNFGISLNHIEYTDSYQSNNMYHSHPFHYLSIVIKGKYVEVLWKDGKKIKLVRELGSVCWRNKNDRHRIVAKEGDVWTLFFWFGSVYNDFGLYDEKGNCTVSGLRRGAEKGKVNHYKKR